MEIKNKKAVLMFCGQGSQYSSMGLDFAESNPSYNHLFDKASEILGEDIKDIISGQKSGAGKLENTFYSQCAIYTVSCMYNDFIKKSLDINFFSNCGHSLGDYSAMYSSKFYSFEKGFELVKFRGKLMSDENERIDGMMAAVLGAGMEDIKKVIDENNLEVFIANYNDYLQTVISGERKNVEEAIQSLKNSGIRKVIPLKVKAASHSPLMEQSAKKLKEYMDKIDFSSPEIPFYSSSSLGYADEKNISALMEKQIVTGVNWVKTIEFFLENKVEIFIETGPGKVLSSLTKRIAEKNKKDPLIFSTDKIEDIDSLIKSFG